jgi:ankyrin repeat protein
MIRQLPDRADLEHLRNEAKQVLSELRSGVRPSLGIEPPYRLSHAQLVLAREYGFDSWSKLKRHVEGYATRRDAFFAALRAGDRTRVAALLAEDPVLANARNPHAFGEVPITRATVRSDIPMIDLLLDAGADPNGKSDWWAGGFGALDFANDPVTDHLLGRGARLTAHAAARLGRADALRRVLAEEPDSVNQRGGDGQMPLHLAKTPEIVDILVEAGADIEARDIDHEGTPAQYAIENESVLRRLLEHGAMPDVFIAARLGDRQMLERMLDADPEAIGRSTDQPGNPQVPKAPGWHIYTYSLGFVWLPQVADRFGHEEIYQMLMSRCTPKQRLLFGCWRADRSAVLAELASTPDLVSQLTPEEQHLLPAAAWQRKAGAVGLMLEIGFDVDVRGGEESTAVDRAAFHGFDDVIEVILPYQPDLTVRNVYGGTPLSACVFGSLNSWRKDGDYPRSVRLLLEAGAPRLPEISGSPEVQAVLAEFQAP